MIQMRKRNDLLDHSFLANSLPFALFALSFYCPAFEA